MYFLKEVLIHKVYDHGFHVEVCRRIPLVFLFDIILLWSRSKASCTFHWPHQGFMDNSRAICSTALSLMKPLCHVSVCVYVEPLRYLVLLTGMYMYIHQYNNIIRCVYMCTQHTSKTMHLAHSCPLLPHLPPPSPSPPFGFPLQCMFLKMN